MTTADPALEELALAVASGDSEAAVNLTQGLLSRGVSPKSILSDGLLEGIQKIGEQFRHNQVYVPEVILAGAAMRAGLDVLRPALVKGEARPAGRVLLATCYGDVHDLGKILVGIMLEGSGFEIKDLGVNVRADAILKETISFRPHIVGLAVGMTTTLNSLKSTIETLAKSEVRSKYRVIVGGMPLTRELALQFGADGYAPDAASAVGEAKRLMSSLQPADVKSRR